MISAKLSLKFLLKQKGNADHTVKNLQYVAKINSVAELLKQSNMSDKTVNRPDLDYVQEDLEAFWHKQKHKWWNDEHK